jgi:hypothetical protein
MSKSRISRAQRWPLVIALAVSSLMLSGSTAYLLVALGESVSRQYQADYDRDYAQDAQQEPAQYPPTFVPGDATVGCVLAGGAWQEMEADDGVSTVLHVFSTVGGCNAQIAFDTSFSWEAGQ